MNLWRPIDRQGQWIYQRWTHLWQVRTGVLMVNAGAVLICFGYFSDESPLIYQMSAWTVLFGGLGVVVTAMLALQTSDTAEDVDDLVAQHEEDGDA